MKPRATQVILISVLIPAAGLISPTLARPQQVRHAGDLPLSLMQVRTIVTRHRPAPRRARPSPPVRLRRVGWGPGEALTYAVKLAGIAGGRVGLSVGPCRSRTGRRTVKIRGLGQTTPFISTFRRMQEELITLLDLHGLAPLSSVSERQIAEEQRRVETIFGQAVRQTIRREAHTYSRRRVIRGVFYDPITALFALRSIQLRKGDRLSLRILSGTSLYRVGLEVTGPERLYPGLGPVDTIRIDGIALRITDAGEILTSRPPRRVTLWLATSLDRRPIRLVGDTPLGQLEAEISSFKAAPRGLGVRVAGLP